MKLPQSAYLLLAAVLVAFPLFAQKTKTAAIRVIDGAPALLVNGQPELPFMYALTHVSGGRWSWEELPAHNLRNACSDGIRLYQVDLWLEDIWPAGSRRLDMTLVRRQLRGVLDACPDAGIVVRLHVNAPMWWNQAHPDECVQFADGPVEAYPTGLPFNHEDGDPFRSVRASLASAQWRKDAGDRVREFCRRLARTREGRAVLGMHLSCGVYGEWHPWGFVKHEPDISSPMQQAFRHWLTARYGSDARLQLAWNDPNVSLTTAMAPDTTLRRCCTDGFFRNPEREQHVLDFYRCQQEIVASDIEYFCRLVKQNWKRPLITGAFYGYFHFSLCRPAMGGHLEIERILNSPWIDYLAGPTSYNKSSRAVGGSGLERSIVESVLRHGKLWFDEVDNGYLQDKKESDFVRSRPLGDSTYLTMFQRSLWLPLVQGCGLWLYDFGPRRNTGWWDGDMYHREIRRTREFFEKQARRRKISAADALVVWDTESFYFAKNENTKTCERGLDDAAEELQRCGITTDHTYLFDLPKIKLDQYKAVLFMNAWNLNPGQRQFILDSVAAAGRTIIWNYLAGYSNGSRTGKKNVETLTGIRLERIVPPDTVQWHIDTLVFKNTGPVEPLLVVADSVAISLGFLTDSAGAGLPVIARKKTATHTSVYAGVPLHSSDVFRRLFREAGCRVLNEKNDFSYLANNFLLLHTNEKGPRLLFLPNSTVLQADLAAPDTRLLDAQTGEILLD